MMQIPDLISLHNALSHRFNDRISRNNFFISVFFKYLNVQKFRAIENSSIYSDLSSVFRKVSESFLGLPEDVKVNINKNHSKIICCPSSGEELVESTIYSFAAMVAHDLGNDSIDCIANYLLGSRQFANQLIKCDENEIDWISKYCKFILAQIIIK